MTREEAIRRARVEIEEAIDKVIATALADDSCVTAAHEAALQLALLEDGALRVLYDAGFYEGLDVTEVHFIEVPRALGMPKKDPSKGDR